MCLNPVSSTAHYGSKNGATANGSTLLRCSYELRVFSRLSMTFSDITFIHMALSDFNDTKLLALNAHHSLP